MDGGSAALNSLVVKGTPFNIKIGVQTIRSLRGKLDYVEDVVRFKIGEKIIALRLDPDDSKYLLAKSDTDSGCFTSDTEIAPESSLEEEEAYYDHQEWNIVQTIRGGD